VRKKGPEEGGCVPVAFLPGGIEGKTSQKEDNRKQGQAVRLSREEEKNARSHAKNSMRPEEKDGLRRDVFVDSFSLRSSLMERPTQPA